MKRITFDELVEHGKANGGNIVNGMPWSFSYAGYAVTHENDNCYLICLPGPPHTLRFERGDTLVLDIRVEKPAQRTGAES